MSDDDFDWRDALDLERGRQTRTECGGETCRNRKGARQAGRLFAF